METCFEEGDTYCEDSSKKSGLLRCNFLSIFNYIRCQTNDLKRNNITERKLTKYPRYHVHVPTTDNRKLRSSTPRLFVVSPYVYVALGDLWCGQS